MNETPVLMYHSEDENVVINALIKDDTVWLTQKAMAELFAVEAPAINKHLKNIFLEGELQEDATVSKMEIVQAEGTRNHTHFMLWCKSNFITPLLGRLPQKLCTIMLTAPKKTWA